MIDVSRYGGGEKRVAGVESGSNVLVAACEVISFIVVAGGRAISRYV